MKTTDSEIDEGMTPLVIGHLFVRDVDTGEVLLNQRDVDYTSKEDTDASD